MDLGAGQHLEKPTHMPGLRPGSPSKELCLQLKSRDSGSQPAISRHPEENSKSTAALLTISSQPHPDTSQPQAPSTLPSLLSRALNLVGSGSRGSDPDFFPDLGLFPHPGEQSQ